MADLTTQAQLLQRITTWKPSRLGNYEAGISTPGPDDVKLIAEATGVSPCWLMFGDGPIRPNARDMQAIRHQNLTHMVEQLKSKRGALTQFARSVGVSRSVFEEHLANPFLPIGAKLCARIEKHFKHPKGWMNEQHIEDDPLCQSFPDDIREVMALYSSLAPTHRDTALATLRALVGSLNEH